MNQIIYFFNFQTRFSNRVSGSDASGGVLHAYDLARFSNRPGCNQQLSHVLHAYNLTRFSNNSSRFAKDHDIEYLVEFSEEKSAKNFTERVQFQKLDKILQKDDTVVFKDISRFTREAENGYKKYMEWLDRGINVVFIDNPTETILFVNRYFLKTKFHL